MIVEVRTYRIKPGRRDEFIKLFESRTAPAQRAHGMIVFGPLVDLETPDTIVWLRGFPSLEARDEMKSAFYEGAAWKTDLEPLAIPMLEQYDVMLTETSPGCVGFQAPGASGAPA